MSRTTRVFLNCGDICKWAKEIMAIGQFGRLLQLDSVNTATALVNYACHISKESGRIQFRATIETRAIQQYATVALFIGTTQHVSAPARRQHFTNSPSNSRLISHIEYINSTSYFYFSFAIFFSSCLPKIIQLHQRDRNAISPCRLLSNPRQLIDTRASWQRPHDRCRAVIASKPSKTPKGVSRDLSLKMY